MGDLRIKVGASLDADALTVFAPLEKAAQRARKSIQKDLEAGAAASRKALEGSAAGMAGPYRTGAKQAGDAISGLTKNAKQQADEMTKDVARSARDRVRLEKQAMREIEADLRRSVKERDKAAAAGNGGARRAGGDTAYRMGYWSMRNFAPVTPTLSIAKNIAGSFARGAGVSTDLSTYVKSYVDRQKLATEISNSAYMPEGGVAGANKRVAGSTIMSEATSVAKETATDSAGVLAGLQAFVAKTGDLETGRKILKDMAVLSKATGTNMEDMVSAAADISKQLPEGVDKAKILSQTMRVIAGQGQVGAIEIRDLTTNMAKLAAQAGKFGLEKGTSDILAKKGLTDSTGQNIAVMGALAQAAMQTGGKGTVGTATNASMAFIRDLSSQLELKRLSAAGIGIYTDKTNTTTRDPKAIILDILDHARGDETKISKYMPNQNSRAVVGAFNKTYKDSIKSGKSNQDALKDVSARYDSLLNVAMSGDQVMQGFNERMQDAESKAQQFQNNLQELADKMVQRVIPALEQLTPKLLTMADAAGKFIGWASENPGQALGVAFAASMAKAGLEQTIRTGVEAMFKGGAPGAAGAVGAVAIAAMTVTAIYVDNFFTKKNEETRSSVASGIEGGNLASKVRITGEASAEEETKLRASLDAKLNERNELRKKDTQGGALESFIGGLAYITGQGGAMSQAQSDRQINEQATAKRLNDEISGLKEAIRRMGKDPMKVQVIGGGVNADASGRASPYSPNPYAFTGGFR